MNRYYKNYILALVATVFSVLVAVYSINRVVDPMWYFGGNKISPVNFTYNERLSKTNNFLNRIEDIDCIIFGSSRTTLLDERSIEGYTCFNYSFSQGNIDEYIYFSDYLSGFGINPSLVVIGLDDYNFNKKGLPDNVPEFVREHEPPPSHFKTYLSLDALQFSIRTLLGLSPLPRFYNEDLIAQVRDDAPVYKPKIRDRAWVKPRYDTIDKLKLLVSYFPGARVIAFSPPISAWRVAEKGDEEFEHYLEGVYSSSEVVSSFYDFTLPSKITRAVNNTYDGHHYSVAINNLIADKLNEKEVGFGINVHELNRADYFSVMKDARRKFVDGI
ncbi:MAG: hypothetical protein V7746_12700 [Halioglobus sp.]